MTETYFLNLENTVWDQTNEYLLSFISHERKERISYYYFDNDKKLSLYSALLTKMMLSKLIGVQVSQLHFGRQELKKPILLSHPSVHFNFSHTRDCVFLGISDCPLGVDVEKMSNAPFEIMDLIFHPSEIKYILESPLEERNLHFYKIWTRKESFVKESGEGLSYELKQLNVMDTPNSLFFSSCVADGYMASIYSKKSKKMLRPKKVDVAEIEKFYKEMT